MFHHVQVTRLIPDAKETTCNQELEPIINTKHSHILRVPFYTEKGILRQWVSRFDIYPYLERFSQAWTIMFHLIPLFPILHSERKKKNKKLQQIMYSCSSFCS